MKKRYFSVSCMTLLPALALTLGLSLGANAQSNEDSLLYAKAAEIHKEVISIDSHVDSEYRLTHPEVKRKSLSIGQVTIDKMYKGNLDAAFFAVYLAQKGNTPRELDSVYRFCRGEILDFRSYLFKKRDSIEIAYSPADIVGLKRRGKRAAVLAIENGYGIGDKIERIEEFFQLGVRYITLCHSSNNLICESCTEKEHADGLYGLSDFGRKVVDEMNRVGMIIDVSHASSNTLRDLLQYSKAPVIATHSAVWELKHHKRNLTDDEMRAIAAKGGVIQVASGRWCLSELPKDQVNVSTLADHIDHVRRVVGIEHVGIGTDFDGGGGVVGMEDCSKMTALTVELLRRGYTKEDLRLFWGGNLMRVWQNVLDMREYSLQARALHKEILSIDSHIDSEYSLLRPDYVDPEGLSIGQVTPYKMYQGGLSAAFFAVFVEQGPDTRKGYDSAYAYTINELDNLKEYVSQRADSLEWVTSPQELRRVHREGKKGFIPALENGYGMGDSIDHLDTLCKRGVQYVTLCHFRNNHLCGSSTEKKDPGKGLTPFGREAVERMNRLGMMIDLSHASTETLYEVLELSKAPVLATHYGVRAVNDLKRNLSDEEIKALAAKGGVVQVASGAWFVSPGPEREAMLDQLIEHILHVKNLVGIEHVGLGTDFDGGGGVKGFEDCTQISAITEKLLAKGFTKQDLELFWGGNLMRLWEQVKSTAKELQNL